MRWVGVLSWTVATMCLAAPGSPVHTSPADGGWCDRTCQLSYRFNPVLDTVSADLEVMDEFGAVVASRTEPLSSPPDDQWTTPSLPDSGFFSWRVRARDDAGATSAWSTETRFLVDGVAPSAPTLTVELDGGALRLLSGPMVDLESGVATYHFGLSRIDQLDGSIVFGGAADLASSVPTRALFIGPGTWRAGVHGHDRVANIGPTTVSDPFVVDDSPALPTPEIIDLVRSDGGPWFTFPYVSVDTLRFRVDAGGVPVSALTFSRKGASDTDWEYGGSGPGPELQVITLAAGNQDVRVAVVSGAEVSRWSAPLRVWVDEGDPLSLTLTATIDAGTVTLSWPYGRDQSNGNSGIRDYEVRRLGADASVTFPPVPHVSAGTITFSDAPGFGRWTWLVRSFDRVNRGSPTAQVVTDLPAAAPMDLRVTNPLTAQPFTLAWSEDRDGGFTQTWTVVRVDASDAGVVVASDVASPGFTDDAPEGVWSFEVFAVVEGVAGPAARVDGALRDRTGPVVSAPTLTRRGARTVELDWSVMDALTTVASVEVQREVLGVTSSLGALSAPALDTPATDGTWRYRVIATDTVGNTSTSDWSVGFVVPGEGVVVAPLEPRVVACGETVRETFSATEAVTWSMRGASERAQLDATSGEFVWTPAASEAGAWTVVVRGAGASSADERTWSLEVQCERRENGVGCGCSQIDLSLGAVVLAWWLRRARRSNAQR